MIAVLIPVLGRPHRVEPLIASLDAATTDVPLEIVFLCSPGDLDEIEACDATGETVIVAEWDAGAGDYARKVNLGYRETAAPYVFTGADDLDFQPGWAEAALEQLVKTDAGVCGTNDDANPLVKKGLHATHSLVSRAYVEECGATFDGKPGVLLHEGYDHQYVDTELVQVAMSRGCWTFAADAHVTHLHPFYDRGVARDATYEKGLARGRQDRRIFDNRLRAWQRS